ncbi:MAG: ABC transporter permease [Cyanobacteria bacterium J06621_15]
MRSIIKSILPEILGLTTLIIIWYLAAINYSAVVLPSPIETFIALKNLIVTNRLLIAVGASIFHIVTGFTIAVLAGTILGIFAGLIPWLRRFLAPTITAFQGIPPIGWIVIALLWFGNGSGTSIFTVAVATLPVIFISTVDGISTADSQLLEMASLFRTPKRFLLLDIYFPHLLSYLFTALTTGIGLAFRLGIMAELLSAETGIGAELNLARINLETPEVMAWICVVLIIILISEYVILRPLRLRLEPWRNSTRKV